MQIKKYPHAVLENYSKLMVLLGLVLSLFITYEFMEMKSYPGPIKEFAPAFIKIEDSEQIVEVKPLEMKSQKTTRAVIPERILKVADEIEIEETIIESTETDESEAITVEAIVEEVEEEEVIIEDVPFMIIEEVPTFPGCSGNNSELKKCFSARVSKFVLKEFNAELASDLGLQSGSTQRIFVLFRIDKTGNIVDIKARAPHKKLQEEAIRVVKMLPKMEPGKQRGVPVGVKYGLPITFKVQ